MRNNALRLSAIEMGLLIGLAIGIGTMLYVLADAVITR